MTKQPLFPLADTPDVSTWSRRATRTWPSTRRSPRRRGSSSTAHPGPRSCRRSTSSRLVDPTLAPHVLLTVRFTSHMRDVPSREFDRVRGRSDRDRDPRGLLLWRHRAKSPLSDGLEPVRHLGELPLWPGRTSCEARRHDRCLRGVLASQHAVQRACSSQDEQHDHPLLGGDREDASGLRARWPAGLACTWLAVDQLDLEGARVGRSERIAL